MTSFHDPSSAVLAGCRDIPQAPGPEKGVLALLVMDPATYMPQAVTFGVTEDFFYIPAHQLLWRLFLARYNANLPLDIISITQALADMRQLDAVGGSAGLADIYTFTTTGAYFEHYLRALRDKSLLRSIIDASTKSMTQAFDNPEDVAALLDAVKSGSGPRITRTAKVWLPSSRRPSPTLNSSLPARGRFRGFPLGLTNWTARATASSLGTCSSLRPGLPWGRLLFFLIS